MTLGTLVHEPLHHASANRMRLANFDINATYGYIGLHHLQVLSFTYRYTPKTLHLEKAICLLKHPNFTSPIKQVKWEFSVKMTRR